MKLESVGILLGLRPFEERDFIATFLTRDFGIIKGMIRGGQVAKKNKNMVGQFGAVSWNARLDSQLGTFHFESEKNLIANLMMNPNSLKFVNSAFALLSSLLPEREKYEFVFDSTIKFLTELQTTSNSMMYLNWEMGLLCDLGYGLNLTACSNCGCKNDLNYLSPKTGRAVCDKCAEPYIDKLFKLPLSITTTKLFLDKIYIQHGVKMPIERQMLN